MSKVSLIITVYNCQQYLEQAIASVVKQTYQDWELIIWDDGSSDRSSEIAQSFAEIEPRIKLVIESHQGRNAALRKAHVLTEGEYVAYLDADDLLFPTTLQETVDILESNLQYGMVYTDHKIIDSQNWGRGIGTRCHIPYSPQRLLVDFMTFHFRLIRRGVFESVGGITQESGIAEDYDLCLRLSEVTQIYHLTKPLYYYRIHESQMSQEHYLIQMRDSEQAVNRALQRRGLAEKYRLYVDENNGKFRLVKLDSQARNTSEEYLKQGHCLQKQNQFRAAIEAYKSAIRLNKNFSEAYLAMGNLLQQGGKYRLAQQCFARVSSLQADSQ